MVQPTQRDPLTEALLRLAKETGFRQEGGAATTRAQITRHLRPSNRHALDVVVKLFSGPEETQRRRAASSRASEMRARNPQDLAQQHRAQAAIRILEARKERVREREQAQDQLEMQVKTHLGVVVEEQAKLARTQEEQQQTKERAVCMAQLHQRGRRLRPILEDFTKRQWSQIQAVRDRMSGDADSSGDADILERVGQLCGRVQQEISQQLNTKSMTAAAAAAGPGALMLTASEDPELDTSAGALAVQSRVAPASSAYSMLEPELHLSRTSQLRRQIGTLIQLPPYKLLQAVTQLARDTRNNLTRQLGSWDLLADARRRCQALGVVVDPLHDIRRMQQAVVEYERELRRLETQVKAVKLRLIELAQNPAVKLALANPLVKERIQVEGHRAMYNAARASYEALRRDASAQESLMEELSRLESTAGKQEREESRLGGLVSLLMESQERVLAEWQQQHPETKEFLQSMLPKAYDELIDAMGQNADRLMRSVTELMRVPPELLPVLAEQRRMHRLQVSAEGGGSGGAAGLPSPASMPLLERLRLALPYVGNQRSAAMLRAAAGVSSGSGAHLHASGSAAGFQATHGSLLHVSTISVASSHSGRGSASDGPFRSGVLGGGGGNASGANGSTGWASPGVTSSTGGGGGSWSGPGQGHGFGTGNINGSGSISGTGSWLTSPGNAANTVAPSAIAWGPGPAALGLPGPCYYLATVSMLDPLAPLRCPAALVRNLHDRCKASEQVGRWLASADAQLKSRQRELSALRPTNAAVRERLEAKRLADAEECISRIARSRRDMMAALEEYRPRVERAMRDSEEQGAIQLVPWHKVDGLTAAEMLDEIRSLFARIAQLQQHHQPLHDHIYGGNGMLPPGGMGF